MIYITKGQQAELLDGTKVEITRADPGYEIEIKLPSGEVVQEDQDNPIVKTF